MGRETVADIVGRIISGSIVDSEAVDLLLRLAERLSRTKGKKVYGYLKADDKALVNRIIDILAKNEDIAKLYDLWYEQREEVIRTYTDTMPKRIPLSANKDFKSIKNAVIGEAMKLCADASVIKSDSGSDSPGYVTHARENAAFGVINLMRYVSRIFDNDIRDDDKRYRMDRKEYQKIAEKKQAHGQKME